MSPEEDIRMFDPFSEDFLVEYCDENDLDRVESLSIRVNTRDQIISGIGARLPNLQNLTLLNPSALLSIRDLGTRFAGLRKAKLEFCKLRDLDGISSMDSLEQLFLKGNLLDDVSALAMHERLKVLDLSLNMVLDVNQVDLLGTCCRLENLQLRGNPIAGMTQFAQVVAHHIPDLRVLDGKLLNEMPADSALLSYSNSFASLPWPANLTNPHTLTKLKHPPKSINTNQDLPQMPHEVQPLKKKNTLPQRPKRSASTHNLLIKRPNSPCRRLVVGSNSQRVRTGRSRMIELTQSEPGLTRSLSSIRLELNWTTTGDNDQTMKEVKADLKRCQQEVCELKEDTVRLPSECSCSNSRGETSKFRRRFFRSLKLGKTKVDPEGSQKKKKEAEREESKEDLAHWKSLNAQAADSFDELKEFHLDLQLEAPSDFDSFSQIL